MNHYISSFADNGLELKYYLNEEVGRLKKELNSCKKSSIIGEDEDLSGKVNKVLDLLSSYEKKEIDTNLIEVVLKTQEFIEEINRDDTIS